MSDVVSEEERVQIIQRRAARLAQQAQPPPPPPATAPPPPPPVAPKPTPAAPSAPPPQSRMSSLRALDKLPPPKLPDVPHMQKAVRMLAPILALPAGLAMLTTLVEMGYDAKQEWSLGRIEQTTDFISHAGSSVFGMASLLTSIGYYGMRQATQPMFGIESNFQFDSLGAATAAVFYQICGLGAIKTGAVKAAYNYAFPSNTSNVDEVLTEQFGMYNRSNNLTQNDIFGDGSNSTVEIDSDVQNNPVFQKNRVFDYQKDLAMSFYEHYKTPATGVAFFSAFQAAVHPFATQDQQVTALKFMTALPYMWNATDNDSPLVIVANLASQKGDPAKVINSIVNTPIFDKFVEIVTRVLRDEEMARNLLADYAIATNSTTELRSFENTVEEFVDKANEKEQNEIKKEIAAASLVFGAGYTAYDELGIFSIADFVADQVEAAEYLQRLPYMSAIMPALQKSAAVTIRYAPYAHLIHETNKAVSKDRSLISNMVDLARLQTQANDNSAISRALLGAVENPAIRSALRQVAPNSEAAIPSDLSNNLFSRSNQNAITSDLTKTSTSIYRAMKKNATDPKLFTNVAHEAFENVHGKTQEIVESVEKAAKFSRAVDELMGGGISDTLKYVALPKTLEHFGHRLTNAAIAKMANLPFASTAWDVIANQASQHPAIAATMAVGATAASSAALIYQWGQDVPRDFTLAENLLSTRSVPDYSEMFPQFVNQTLAYGGHDDSDLFDIFIREKATELANKHAEEMTRRPSGIAEKVAEQLGFAKFGKPTNYEQYWMTAYKTIGQKLDEDIQERARLIKQNRIRAAKERKEIKQQKIERNRRPLFKPSSSESFDSGRKPKFARPANSTKT